VQIKRNSVTGPLPVWLRASGDGFSIEIHVQPARGDRKSWGSRGPTESCSASAAHGRPANTAVIELIAKRLDCRPPQCRSPPAQVPATNACRSPVRRLLPARSSRACSTNKKGRPKPALAAEPSLITSWRQVQQEQQPGRRPSSLRSPSSSGPSCTVRPSASPLPSWRRRHRQRRFAKAAAIMTARSFFISGFLERLTERNRAMASPRSTGHPGSRDLTRSRRQG